MKVLMLSRDPKIFEDSSEVRMRMLEYAKSVEELYIIVFAKNSRRAESQNYHNLHLYSANSLLDMYKIGKKITNDLITSQDPFETGLIGYLLKRRHQIPLELQVHTDFLSPYFWRESFKNKIRVILAKFLIKKADHLRVVSERIKKSVIAGIDYPEAKIETRPIFIDTEKIKKAPVKTDLHNKYPNRFIVLMASRLTREKNIPMAIEAIQKIVGQHPQALLLIVGEGPELSSLKLLIKSYQLEENIIFEPYTDDLVSYYKTADLFLLTSNYEGYGRTAVEARAAGLPVLMTDVGVAIGEIFPVGDLKVLIAKLSAAIAKSKK